MAGRVKQGEEIAGYSNADNPFGDAALTDRCADFFLSREPCSVYLFRSTFLLKFRLGCRFVWRKKIEKQIIEGVDVKDLGLKAERQRQQERLVRAQCAAPGEGASWLASVHVVLSAPEKRSTVPQAEIEKVKQRRKEREAEKEQMDAEKVSGMETPNSELG